MYHTTVLQGVVLKLLLTGVQLKPMTKNNYWELDPHILGLDTTKIKLFFSIEKNLNLKILTVKI